MIFSGSKDDFESEMDSVSYDDTLIKLIENAWISFFLSLKKNLLMS